MPDPVFEDTTQGVFRILFPPGESQKDAFPDASRLKLCLNTIFPDNPGSEKKVGSWIV